MNIYTLFEPAFEKYNDKTAIEFNGAKQTYGELERNTGRAASRLVSLDVQKGDRVAILLPKCLEFLYFHMANLRYGSITLPLNPAYAVEEVKYFLEDSGATLFITDREWLDKAGAAFDSMAVSPRVLCLESGAGVDGVLSGGTADPAGSEPPPVHPAAPDDVAALLYTSGTTGKPKGAMITHGNLVANNDTLFEAWGWSDSDVMLHALPLFHVHGLFVALHVAFRAGASVIMLEKFDPIEVLRTIETRICTVFMGVPTMYNRFVNLPESDSFDLSGARLMVAGSAPLSATTFRRFKQRFGIIPLERYGMTEVGMAVSNPLDDKRKAGAIGLPLPGVEIRIVKDDTLEPVAVSEVGEVQIKGANVFKGYWNQPEKTAETFTADGWLKSGDLGYFDEDGYIILVGRSKELIITGGLNVYPKEVEVVLDSFGPVLESAVLGVPDPDFGEKIVAVLVPKGDADIDTEELSTFCRTRLASYKCPRIYTVIGALPRNAMGKVRKTPLLDLPELKIKHN